MTTSQAGDLGEEAVREVLRELKGTLINGFIRTNNLKYQQHNFQLDFLTFVPRIGLVNIEVKNWKGTVKASSNNKWQQEIETSDKKYVNEFNNASVQALRTSSLLLQTLETEKLNKWPIRSLVVFTNDNAKIYKAKNNPPQTEIILKSMIPKWLEENASNDMCFKFNKEDFEKVHNTLVRHTKNYAEFG